MRIGMTQYVNARALAVARQLGIFIGPDSASIRHFATHRFHLPSNIFSLKSSFLRTARRLGCPARRRQHGDAGNYFMQALHGFFPVFFLAAMRLRLDDDDAVLGDTLVVQA